MTNSSPSSSQIEQLLRSVNDALYTNIGSQQFATFQNALFGVDSIRNTLYMPEFEAHGFTFVTRPKLNLTTSSLRQDRILTLLDTLDPGSVAFAIRAMLDTRLLEEYGLSTMVSPYFNRLNPFIPILTNRLVSLSGWPDPTLDVETTEGGFFSESITYPKGHDQLTRNYDITANFADIQGSPIMILFIIWARFIHLLTRGLAVPYMEDIDARRMCFTSSIYRFVMDPSNRFITKWAKATGCFPRSVPLGLYFNYDANASHVDVASNLAIPFTVAGKVEYLDPIILKEFNMLMERRNPAIKNFKPVYDELRMRLNFKCLPYIDIESGSNELQWRYDPSDKVAAEIVKLSTSPLTLASVHPSGVNSEALNLNNVSTSPPALGANHASGIFSNALK